MVLNPVTVGAAVSSVGAWVWSTYGKEWTDQLLEEAKTKWDHFNWAAAADTYKQSLTELHSTIRVLGKSDPVALEGIFTDVYILDEVSGRKRYDIEELRMNGEDRFDFTHQSQKRYAGLDLIEDGHNLFILGKPGAGKTTFLRYVALQAAQDRFDRVPIFLELKQWSSRIEEGLMPFIVEQFDLCEFPDAQLFIEHMLSEGKAIVLFDGLDEIKQEDDLRRQATIKLNDFARKYRRSQVLITCRLAASDYQFHNFQDVEIADFTRDQVHGYAHKWFAKSQEKQRAFITDLYEERNKGLRELCTIPLLLSMLCLAFDDTMHFPEQRVDLYEDALDALLRRWDTSRSIRRDEIYQGLSRQQKLRLFAKIGAKTFDDGEYFFEERWLGNQIVKHLQRLPGYATEQKADGQVVLNAIVAQHGLFVERAKGVYAFSHLTFQEYFTAKYIVDSEAGGAVKRLVRQHLTDDRWREVFLLTASMLGNADRFFAEMRSAIDDLLADDKDLIDLLTWSSENASALSEPGEAVKDRAVVIVYALDLDIDRARARARDLALARARARARDIDLARASALALALTRDHDRDHDIDRALDLSMDQLDVLSNYLAASSFLIACLNIATVSDRDKILDSLLRPPKGCEEQG